MVKGYCEIGVEMQIIMGFFPI